MSSDFKIPNIINLTNQIIDLLQYMNQPHIKQLKLHNQTEYELDLESKFPKLSSEFYGLFKLILSGIDLSNLFEMFKKLNQVNNNNIDFQTARTEISDLINNQYVNPILKK